MSINARYVHTNLIAEDWKKLAGFYEEVFGCKIVPPERDFKGKEIEVNIFEITGRKETAEHTS